MTQQAAPPPASVCHPDARDLKKNFSYGRNDNKSELGVFAPWREEYPSIDGDWTPLH